MTESWRLAAAVPALVLLAGCAATDPPALGSEPAATADDRIEWTGCDGVMLALEGPTEAYAGSVPPGWEPSDPTDPTTTLRVRVDRCERVSWGPFERGPVYTVQEWHGGFVAPDTCREEGKYDVRAMLASIWFSDPDLAAYARQAHAMPAHFAAFNQTQSRIGAVTEAVWTWAIPGQAESRVAFYDLGLYLNRTYDIVRRVYWPSGPGVSFMDFGATYENDELGSNLARGTLQPPLLHGSRMPSPEFTSLEAGRQGNGTASAAIHRFTDPACLEPS